MGRRGCVYKAIAPKDTVCLVFSSQEVVYMQAKWGCWSVAAQSACCAVVRGSQLNPGTALVSVQLIKDFQLIATNA